MNIHLYNAFIRAVDFLKTDERNRAKIKQYQAQIRNLHYLLNSPPLSPPTRKKADLHLGLLCFLPIILFVVACEVSIMFDLGIEDVKIEYFIFALICYILLVILYVLFRRVKEYVSYQKDLKQYKEETRQIMASPDYIKHCNDVANEISQLQTLLSQATQEQNTYYQNNYNACLGFIKYENYRTLPHIEAMLSYTKTGEANTFDQAANLHERDLRVMYRESERLEKEAEDRRRYEENQKLQAEILAEQKKISAALEYERQRRNFRSRF